MTPNPITQCEPWMTPHERDLYQDLIRAIAIYLANAGVPENALVHLRINDLAATWLLARRLESALAYTDGEPAPCPTPAQANAIGKCRDRLCKAIKELEVYAAKNGAPATQGLVEQMHQAVRECQPASIPVDNHAPVEPDDLPKPQDPDPETPASPNPANHTTETPGRHYPVNHTPNEHQPLTTPGERRKSNAENRDKYRPSKTARTATDARRHQNHATCNRPLPPTRQIPQDTG